MKHKEDSEILSKLLEITKAKVVQPTHDELMELREIEEQQRQSKIQRDRKAVIVGKRVREQEIFKQAMGEVANS